MKKTMKNKTLKGRCKINEKRQKPKSNAELNELLQDVFNRLIRSISIECSKHGLDVSEAEQEDLVQEMMIEVWQRDLKRWDPSIASLFTFAKKKIPWVLKDWVRRKSRYTEPMFYDGYDGFEEESAMLDDSPEEVLKGDEYERVLLALPEMVDFALKDVARNKKASLLLPIIQEKTSKDVAKQLGLNPSTVTRHAQEMTEKLKKSGFRAGFFVGEAPVAANEDAEHAVNDNNERLWVVKK